MAISRVMAGLVPAIHGCPFVPDVDPRDKPGDDGSIGGLQVAAQALPSIGTRNWPCSMRFTPST
jgi:hypothetical protein